MTEALDSFLSDLRRVADAERIAGRYQQAALMSEAARHIELLRSSTKPATSSTANERKERDTRKERDKHIGETCRQIEDWRAKVEKLQWELRSAKTIINQLDAERWALILTQ